ncbi:hypothetical protein FNV43_RR01604 [Rhamnella rubrinervis]|uniref:Uncharacterized protein n=1 Tax=Rhamnella rubrinervis TaxID=2594499 RepID=A0A8K0MTG3_9ROSA|nr:hypothetical protein FNV43_RR01604 [Rhamnella rubrinervis]
MPDNFLRPATTSLRLHNFAHSDNFAGPDNRAATRQLPRTPGTSYGQLPTVVGNFPDLQATSSASDNFLRPSGNFLGPFQAGPQNNSLGPRTTSLRPGQLPRLRELPGPPRTSWALRSTSLCPRQLPLTLSNFLNPPGNFLGLSRTSSDLRQLPTALRQLPRPGQLALTSDNFLRPQATSSASKISSPQATSSAPDNFLTARQLPDLKNFPTVAGNFLRQPRPSATSYGPRTTRAALRQPLRPESTSSGPPDFPTGLRQLPPLAGLPRPQEQLPASSRQPRRPTDNFLDSPELPTARQPSAYDNFLHGCQVNFLRPQALLTVVRTSCPQATSSGHQAPSSASDQISRPFKNFIRYRTTSCGLGQLPTATDNFLRTAQLPHSNFPALRQLPTACDRFPRPPGNPCVPATTSLQNLPELPLT